MKVILAKVMSRLAGHREAGMATAEYAVGTVAVVSIGGILYKIITDPEFQKTIWEFILWIIKIIMGTMG
ncbi:MAG: DUF4244 domain-containing protein [Propionibacteriaceae bacterium]|jgi:hypothetical protein|nr:DUF4244 domain-containing protein [Propionibacteriaceae bacterium]